MTQDKQESVEQIAERIFWQDEDDPTMQVESVTDICAKDVIERIAKALQSERSKADDLREENERLKAQDQYIQLQYPTRERMRQEIARLSEELSTTKAQLEEAKLIQHGVDEGVEQWNQEISDLKFVISQRDAEISVRMKQLSEVKAQLEKLSAENTQLKSRLGDK